MNARLVRGCAFGFVVSLETLLLATTSQANVPPAALKSDVGITKLAQGCGPGGWRGPGGVCRYGGRCWRGAYGRQHCY
jgi:hypothetical protein